MNKEITATEATDMASSHTNKLTRVSNFLESIYTDIREAANNGRYSMNLTLVTEKDIVNRVVSKLELLGFTVKVTDDKWLDIFWNQTFDFG